MNSKGIIMALAAFILIGGGIIFLGSQMVNQPNFPPQGNFPIGGGPGNIGAPEIKNIEIEGRPFEFNPKQIKAQKGDVVRITFRNIEGFHDFVIDEFNVRTKQIPAGQSDTVQFIADKAGTFEYYCSVGGNDPATSHRLKGMVGTLTVEE